MPPMISVDVKERILTFSALKWSRSLFSKELKKSNIIVFESTVSSVLRNHNNGPANQSINQPVAKKSRPPRKLNQDILDSQGMKHLTEDE